MLQNTNSKDKGVSPVVGVLLMLAAAVLTIGLIVSFIIAPVLSLVLGFSRTKSIITGVGLGIIIAFGILLKNDDELLSQITPTPAGIQQVENKDEPEEGDISKYLTDEEEAETLKNEFENDTENTEESDVNEE